METQQLRHFLAAVQYGNIGKAAEQLNITQSGVSRSIKNLELLVGAPLLVRTARGVEPTAFGASLAPRAHAILNEQQRALDELADIRAKKSGSVRIGITSHFVEYLMPDIINAVMTRQPGVDLSIHAGGFSLLTEQLRVGELDLVAGLVFFSPSLDDLVLIRLFDSSSSVVCSPTHPLAGVAAPTAVDLAAADWAMISSAGFLNAFAAYFQSHVLPTPRVAAKTNSPELLRKIVLSQPVLTVLPNEAVDQDIAEGRLVRLNVDAPAGHASAGILYRAGAVVTPAMREMIDLTRALAAQRPDARAAETPR